jgi:oligopeptide transport system permease protein
LVLAIENVALRSPWASAWARLRRNQLALIGLLVVISWIGLAISADAIAPYSPTQFDFADFEQDASRAHLLGTDFIGRDMFTLILYGSRVSVAVAIIVPVIIMGVGVTVGVLAGYAGGRVDNLLMRFTDTMFAFPSFLFMVIMVTTFGRNMGTIFLALGVSSWPTMARIVRAEVLQIKNTEYVASARAIGAKPRHIILTHFIPNLVGPVMVTAAMSIPAAIATEAFLTFLGIGVEPSTPSWGMIINDAQTSIFWHPTLILFPSLAISSLTLAFSFLGDGLRDALDPRLES